MSTPYNIPSEKERFRRIQKDIKNLKHKTHRRPLTPWGHPPSVGGTGSGGGSSATTLAALTDTDIPTTPPTPDQQVLTWVASESKWKPKSLAAVGISNLAASVITSGIFATARIPTIQESKLSSSVRTKLNKVGSSVSSLDDLNDVTINNAAKGQVIVHDSASFANRKLLISDLSGYHPVLNGAAAYLNLILGMDLKNLGKIQYNTTLESSIGTYDSIKVRYVNPDNEADYKTSIEQVMNFHIHGIKSMALSGLADDVRSAPFNSVLEVFGKKLSSLKIVDTHEYKVKKNTGSIKYGSLSFDVRVPNTSVGKLDFDQSTLVELQALAETKLVTDYDAWVSSKEYGRGDKVVYNNRVYTYINGSTSTGHRPSSSSSRSFWKVFSTTSTDRGKSRLVLRKINSTALGASDDEFKTMLEVDWDHGVYVGSHLTTKEGSWCNFNGSVVLGNSPSATIDAAADIKMHKKKVTDLAPPTDDADAATKKYVDSGSGGGVDLSSVDQDIIPDGNRTRDLGSPTYYFDNGYFDDLRLYDDLDVGGDVDVVGNVDVGGDVDVIEDLSIGGDADISGDLKVDGELEIDGNLNHDGSDIGFRGKTPVPAKTWSIVFSSGSTLANHRQTVHPSTSDPGNLILLCRAFKNLIEDLRNQGILG